MSDFSELERRIDDLQQQIERTKSLKWTMLIVMLGLGGVVFMQLRINDYFKGKFNALERIEMRASDAK